MTVPGSGTRPARAVVWLAVIGTGCAGPAPRPSTLAPAPIERVVQRVFLVGDAGVPAPRDPVLAALAGDVGALPERSTVVFLGDNIYPSGMPAPADRSRPEAERRLLAQLTAAREAARVVFIPGNHDWAGRGREGWDAVRRQETFVAAHGGPNARFLPAGGCAGPATIDLTATLQLVVLDTEWWLRGGPAPAEADVACRANTPGAVTKALRVLLAATGPRTSIVVGHHPLRSGGVHGGHFGVLDHVFPLRAWKRWLWLPLPVVGSAYPLARMAGISSEDLTSGTYGAMRDSLVAALRSHPPLVYAAGHEHNLQILDGAGMGPARLVVSGAGAFAHTSRVTTLAGTRYARAAGGFVRLDFLDDGRTRLGVVIVTDSTSAREEFGEWLDPRTSSP